MALTREGLKKRKKAGPKTGDVTLPDGEKVFFVVSKFKGVRDVIEHLSGDSEDRIGNVALLLARSLVDREGNRLLEDEEKDDLFEAFDPGEYGIIARAVQEGYGILKPVEEVVEDLKDAPGES